MYVGQVPRFAMEVDLDGIALAPMRDSLAAWLADVGVRELTATHLFGLLGQPALPVLSASLSLWVLNIALPSALGLGLLPGLRVLREKRKR